MIKFIHTADWQLGMTRHFLNADAQPRFTAARIEVIGAIGALAEAEGCPFVVVGGDVFETNQVGRQIVDRALEVMRSFPGVTFYLLPGNHDPLDAASVFHSRTFASDQPANVIVLDGTVPVTAAPGVELVAAPWSSKHPLIDLVAERVRDLVADGTVRIVVGHGAVDVLSPDKTSPALISLGGLEACLADGRVSYVALGDRHSTTDVGSSGRVWYSGAPEPTDYVEDDPGNVLVVELDGASVHVESRHVGTWRFVLLDADLTNIDDVDALEARLDEIADKARTIVKLALVGQVSLAARARIDEVLERAASLFGALEHWARRSELVVVPDALDIEELGLSGFATQVVEDLQAIVGSGGDNGVVATDALSLLYRLSKAGS